MKTTVDKFKTTEIDIPKSSEYNSLILTEDIIETGNLFFDSRSERVLILTEIDLKKDLYRLNVYDPFNKKILSSWDTKTKKGLLEEYSEMFIPDFEVYSKMANEYLFEGKEFNVEEFDDESESTALVHNTNKQMLISIHSQIEVQKKKIELIRNTAVYLIETKKQQLSIIKEKMEQQISVFKKEMRKIMKVISMIEIYLGIEEELFHLQEGETCSIDTPISLRQMVLFADEELGNCQDGGIDFRELHLFDEWLVKDKNYLKLIPEERSIVAIKPRRFDKEYGDRWVNTQLNRWNHQTYFLIRNGENLYRICSENIGVETTMFPKRTEFAELLKEIDENKSYFEKERLVERKEDLKDQYIAFSLLVQGLIDRTQVFSPLPAGIKVSEIEEGGMINLIYDAENLLPSDRLSFSDWKNKINENVGRGSRIVLRPDTECKHYGGYWSNKEGFLKYYENEYNMPDKPSKGLYTIEENEYDGNKLLVIKYFPKSDVYSWTGGYSERKNRVSWVIDLKYSWYLNYDRISLDDVNYYLNSRLDRPNYLDILPLLRELKKKLIEEQEKEKDFILMLQGQTGAPKEQVQEAIDWWKFKNIWKRPITKDDEKAYRMIVKRLKNKMK